MVAAGAHEDSARQIAETFHFRLRPKVLHPAIASLDRALASGSGREYGLAIANAIWGQKGYPMLPA